MTPSSRVDILLRMVSLKFNRSVSTYFFVLFHISVPLELVAAVVLLLTKKSTIASKGQNRVASPVCYHLVASAPSMASMSRLRLHVRYRQFRHVWQSRLWQIVSGWVGDGIRKGASGTVSVRHQHPWRSAGG